MVHFPTDANTSHIPPDKLEATSEVAKINALNRFMLPKALRRHRRKSVKCSCLSEFCHCCLF